MYYAFDFDTRTIESKSTTGEDLAAYVIDNDLTLAIAVVGSAEDISNELSMEEMAALYENITMDELEIPKGEICQEEMAGEHCWVALEQAQDEFPNFVKGKVPTAKPKPKAKATKAPSNKPKGTKLTAKSMTGRIFNVTDKCARRGTLMAIIQTCILDNMGAATFEEIREVFMDIKDCDEKYANGYISGSVREGYTVIEEEL